METKEFEYTLPKELIAQEPIEPRDASRLLVLERRTGSVREDVFRNIINYLNPGDVLVLNDTRVIMARLPARKTTGGKAEIFLLKDLGNGKWEALVKPAARILTGTILKIGEDIEVKILEKTDEGSRIVEFPSSEAVNLAMKKHGRVPIPPYIKKPLSNPERYQTVYAEKEGSVAAPTAALHFTPELLKRIENKGVKIVYITLHMGWGSFRIIREERLENYRLPPEYYEISEDAAKEIMQNKERKNRVVACGTDVVRTLETAAGDGRLRSGKGITSLFITPGYKFKIVDVLITNLHLPRSSHLVLVSAFAGRDFVFKAYQYAIDRKFRFYTFGDATIVI